MEDGSGSGFFNYCFIGQDCQRVRYASSLMWELGLGVGRDLSGC